MPWSIENKSHVNQFVAGRIEAVFNQILIELDKKMGFEPPLGVKPIELNFIEGLPRVRWPLQKDKYQIDIAVDGWYPLQVIFQMAHEMCHIYIDPRVNGSFIEIICQKTALDMLDDIGESWTASGRADVDYYIAKVISDSEKLKALTLAQIAPNTLGQRIRNLEISRTLYDREENNLIAAKLIELANPIDKYGIIRYIRNSIIPTPPASIDDLTTTEFTDINLRMLAANIENTNPQLATIIRSMSVVENVATEGS